MKFLTKWATYLLDNHKESCKCFYTLLHIFTELKTKGFGLPDDFEEEEADDNSNANPNKKFELDNQDDPAGLANNEEGQKDVSDQIENEDQLDDTKQKDAESDEEKNDDQKQIPENDKGIEMSEDFDAEMQDAPDEDEKEKQKEPDDDKDGVDELEDLEDQKGDVDDDEQVLDEKLWDEENGPNNEESEEELETLDEDDNPKKQHDKKQELASKSDMNKGDNEDDKDESNQKNEENIEDGNDEDGGDDEGKDDETENDRNQKINDLSDVEENDDEKGDEEEEKSDEKTSEKDKDSKTEDKIDDDNKTEEGKDGEDEDIEMNDQEEEENNEENQESESEKDQKDDLKMEDDEAMPDENNEEEYDEKSDKNTQDKSNMPNQQKQMQEQKDSEKPNNAQDDANAATENIEDQDKEDNENDSEMNSVQDKISKNGQGKLGNQKSQFLDKVEENSRKKIGNKNEEKIVSEEKDKLIENFNLIEIDEKIDDKNGEDNKEEGTVGDTEQNDLRHIQNPDENFDNQIYDAATEKQKEKKVEDIENENFEQKTENFDKKTDPKSEKNDENMGMSEDIPIENISGNKELKSIEKSKNKDLEMDSEEGNNNSELLEVKDEVMDDISEPRDSFFGCQKENLLSYTKNRDEVMDNLKKYRELNEETDQIDLTTESLNLWHDYESLTQQMSKELCEQLRLILEPTVCSKLKGDYKSGKRLNMKRVIEYIATEYRKDKIWLRRIKPNKRDYQVMLAIDNSSSMGDNQCVQLAYETIATLMNAFNYLEVGQLGLLKFGEKVSSLHDLQTNFHSDDGAKIISQIDFKDETTQIAQMLNVSTSIFNSSTSRVQKVTSGVNISKLLIILSDGRGIFYEGMDTVKNAIRNAMQEQIFIVFVLLETPRNKSSIFDIKMPIFEEGDPIPKIKSYMEQFPFPFYVVLKDVNNLSNIIGEALKEWFDMVARLES